MVYDMYGGSFDDKIGYNVLLKVSLIVIGNDIYLNDVK